MNEADRAELTLLVVDDEPENLAAYARALRGYRLVQAKRGDEGLALLAEHPVDIVVTDQRMPGLSGASLLQRARAVNPIVRRIVVSATAAPDQLLEAINRGEVERYLVKPIEPDRLRAFVDELAEEYLRLRAFRARLAELQDQLDALRRAGNAPDAAELFERVELELIRARRYRRPLTLLVFDPSPCVDVVEIRAMLRELDIAMHVGSTLLIVLPETDQGSAELVWDRLSGLMPEASPTYRNCPEDGTHLQALLMPRPR